LVEFLRDRASKSCAALNGIGSDELEAKENSTFISASSEGTNMTKKHAL
jgi:hypothetical protein